MNVFSKSFLIMAIFFSLNLYASKMPGIDWHEGSVQSAFKLAKERSRPLFLYWGALWCPPCNQMKKNVFSKKEFKKVSQKFINVYLDGDDPRAQIWGDKLKAYGYPTMILFSSTGKELTRLPTGVSVKKYVSLMKNSLESQLSVENILDKALGKALLTVEEWNILSGFSWGQASSDSLKEKMTYENFKALFYKAPLLQKEVRARIFMRYLQVSFEEENKKDIVEQRRMFLEVLSSQKQVISTLEDLVWNSKDFLNFLFKEKNVKRKKVIFKWHAAMKKINKDQALSYDERLSALYPLIVLDQRGKKKYQKDIVRFCNKVFKKAKGNFERQASISTAIYLLKKLGKYKAAKKMALSEIKRSAQPYYFMSQLASLLEEQGQMSKALKWRKKGWEATKGGATRFQWGVDYLTAITRLDPSNVKKLKEAGMIIFKESFAYEGAFSGRNFFRLKRITKAYNKWSKVAAHRAKMVADMTKSLGKECEKASLSRKCHSWLSTLNTK